MYYTFPVGCSNKIRKSLKESVSRSLNPTYNVSAITFSSQIIDSLMTFQKKREKYV